MKVFQQSSTDDVANTSLILAFQNSQIIFNYMCTLLFKKLLHSFVDNDKTSVLNVFFRYKLYTCFKYSVF